MLTGASGFNIYFVFIRYARAGVQAFFKGASPSVTSGVASNDTWLPPLTADLLLQPHLGLFPFPSYFSALHEFLATFYHSGTIQSKLIKRTCNHPLLVTCQCPTEIITTKICRSLMVGSQFRALTVFWTYSFRLYSQNFGTRYVSWNEFKFRVVKPKC